MIDQKEKRACGIPGKNPNARLKRSDHALFVGWIEDQLKAFNGALNFLPMMSDNNNGVLDCRAGNRVEDVLQKGSAAKRQERLRLSHPFGFTCS